MASLNFSHPSDTTPSVIDANHLPDNPPNGDKVLSNDSSVEKAHERVLEGQETVGSTKYVPWDRTVTEGNVDLEGKGHSKIKSQRKYCIFPGLPSDDPGTPPDGGKTAWLQVLAGHLMCFVTWGLITSFGVFQSHYEETLRAVPSAVSWIGTTQIFTLLLVGTVSGRASDAGLVHEAVFMGTFLIVFGLFMASLSTHYYQLLLSQGICTGLGMGILYMPGLSVPSSYFKDKKPFAVAIIASGAGSGGLVYPAMVQQLLPRIG